MGRMDTLEEAKMCLPEGYEFCGRSERECKPNQDCLVWFPVSAVWGEAHPNVLTGEIYAIKSNPTATLPMEETDADKRKQYKVCTGFLMYFPNACLAAGKLSVDGNDQHNPGEPLHWDSDKSVGTGDEIVRHLIEGLDSAKKGEDATKALASVFWRAGELLERYLTGMEPFNKPKQ